jgi:hypothetical protein
VGSLTILVIFRRRRQAEVKGLNATLDIGPVLFKIYVLRFSCLRSRLTTLDIEVITNLVWQIIA